LRGKFNLNRLQLPFVLLAFSSFHLFICCHFFSFICCASWPALFTFLLTVIYLPFTFTCGNSGNSPGFVLFCVYIFCSFVAVSSSPSYFSAAFRKCFLWGVENHFVKQTFSCSFSTQKKKIIFN